jgi:hypothetical protein
MEKKTRLSFSFLREWNDDNYDVLANGSEVGRIAGARWMWTLAFGCYEDQPDAFYAVSRGAAMAAFAKKWRGSKWGRRSAQTRLAHSVYEDSRDPAHLEIRAGFWSKVKIKPQRYL